MATKVTGALQKLDFNSQVFGTGGTCLASVEYSDAADAYLTKCAAGSYAGHVTGLRNVTATVNIIPLDTDHAVLNAVAPGVNNTDWEHYPAGETETFIKITASKATVLNRTTSVPVEGLFAVSFVVGLDSFTAAATPAP